MYRTCSTVRTQPGTWTSTSAFSEDSGMSSNSRNASSTVGATWRLPCPPLARSQAFGLACALGVAGGCADRRIRDTSDASIGEGTNDVGSGTQVEQTDDESASSQTDPAGPTSDTGNTSADSTSGGPECAYAEPAVGCPCSASSDCPAGHICNVVAQLCVSVSCASGSEGCSCTPGGACNPELQCISEFCHAPDCPSASAGCRCIDDFCQPGLVCNDDELCG